MNIDENTLIPPSFVKIEGINFPGTIEGHMTREEMQNLRIAPDFLINLLPHFVKISDVMRVAYKTFKTYKARSEEPVPVTDEVIDNLMSTAGSKFNRMISDPEHLTKFVQEILVREAAKREIPWILNRRGFSETPVKLTVSIFEKHNLGLAWEDYIGDANVVKITPEIKDRVYQQQRGSFQEDDNIMINKIKVAELPQTDDIIAVLRKSPDGQTRFWTMYPGVIAPSMPNARQTPEEREISEKYWSQHAFAEVEK